MWLVVRSCLLFRLLFALSCTFLECRVLSCAWLLCSKRLLFSSFVKSFESQQTNSQLTPGPPATARILSFCSGFSCVFLPGKLFLLAIENNNETAVEFVQAPVHQPVQSWVHGVLQLRIKLL